MKLSKIVKQELELQNAPCYFWTDFTIVIDSLRANVKKFLMFPSNRLEKILIHSKLYDWNFEGTEVNPADKLNRGISAKLLAKDKAWFEGPQFLRLRCNKWRVVPQNLPPHVTDFTCFDFKSTSLTSTCADASEDQRRGIEMSPMFKLIAAFSSIYRLKLAAAWISRFNPLSIEF